MNNLELSSVKLEALSPVVGLVTGLELEDGDYHIIINGALHKVTPDAVATVTTSKNPLLNGILFNIEEQWLFVCDGYDFLYQLEDGGPFTKISCLQRLAACTYSPAMDKIACLDVHKNVTVCDVNVDDSSFMQESLWSLNDDTPPNLNVNWGNAESQFAGFDNTTSVDAIRQAAGDDCISDIPEIVWRPDGKFFLVAYKHKTKRRFKVYSVNSGVVAENEDISGLQAPIAWRLTHNMITVACCSDDTWRLVIYEGSGYAKMVINMEEKARITQLTWSYGGKILAVVQEGESEWYITLFTVGNYSFEVKQKLVFKSDVRYVQWRPPVQGSHHLVVVMEASAIHYYFQLSVTSTSVYVNGANTTAVIDDCHVAFINFETFLVPPPYKRYEFTNILEFPNTVNQVVFNAAKDTALCIDCHNNYYIYDYVNRRPRTIKEDDGLPLPTQKLFPLNVHHLGFFDDYVIFFVTEAQSEKAIKYHLVEQSIESVISFRSDLAGVRFIKTDFALQDYTYYTNGDFCVNGQLRNNFKNGVKKVDKIVYERAEYLFVLDNKGQLFSNDHLIASHVTSFVLFSQYVLFTTSDHKLMSSRLDVFGDTFLTDNEPHLAFDCRTIEEGGTLVVGVANKLIAILQMPRGNMEMVSSDLLGIDSVNNLLSMGYWRRAVNETRLRQLNPNILIDSNMERFIHNTEKFLAVQTVASLIDFVFGLCEHNVVRKMSCRFQFSRMIDTPRKIERVCSKLLEEMEQMNLGQYMEAIVVTRTKQFGIQNAIDFMQKAYSRRNLDVNKVVERGLKIMCMYWNPEEVAAACLKTYDLDFSLYSHFLYRRDPQLTSMLIDTFADSKSEYEQRFKVNYYVGDHRSATTYLAMHMLHLAHNVTKDCSFDPLIDYAQAHQELETLYKFLRQKSVSVVRLCRELAEYFESINRQTEAAELYLEAGDCETSLALYINMYKWEEAMHIIEDMKIDPGEKAERLKGLADHLNATGVYAGATSVYLNIKDYSKAIEACIRSRSFIRAVSLCYEFYPDIKEVVKTELYAYAVEIEDLIHRSKKDVEELTSRVETIWEERMAAARATIADDSSDYDTANEYAESVRTVGSTMRSYGSTTSRKSRKEQRRYLDMKQGSPYEDIAIMRTVHNKITELCKMQTDIKEITLPLIDFQDHKRAMYVDVAFKEMVESFKDCVARIWVTGLTTSTEVMNEKLMAARKNLEFMEEKYRSPPEILEKQEE